MDSPLMVDFGSGVLKAGYSGEDTPRLFEPSMVGKPKYEEVMILDNKSEYIGMEAVEKRGILKLEYPINRGVVQNWESYENCWKYIFKYLKRNSNENCILMSEIPFNPKNQREKKLEILFEKFECPGSAMVFQGVLSLIASGRGTGIIVNCGDGVVEVLPITEGYSLPHATFRLNLGGRDITQDMMHRLRCKGHTFSTSGEFDIIREMKHDIGYVANNFEEEISKFECSDLKKKFILPDGREVEVQEEMFMSPEILFQPSLIGVEGPGVHELVEMALKKVDIDLRCPYYSNVIISGGSSMFPGFCDRLEREIKKRIPKSMVSKVVSSPSRFFSVWEGGSILSSLSTFKPHWITKQQFEEQGYSIIQKLCWI